MLQRQKWIILPAVVALLLLAWFQTTGRRGTGPRPSSEDNAMGQTLTDLANRPVKITRDARRIVLIRGRDIYELAALLGDDLPKRLVAIGADLRRFDRDGYEAFIAKYPSLASLPEAGDIFKDAVNPEQIVNLHPDLVLADKFMVERGYKCLAQIEAAGLPLLCMDLSDDPFSGPQRSLLLLGKVLGKDAQKRAQAIVSDIDQRLATVMARIEALPSPGPSVYLEASGTPTQFGVSYGAEGNPRRYSGWGAILHRLRVQNIADGIVGDMGKLHPEFILKADPQIIVITGQSWEDPGTLHLGYGATAAPGLQKLGQIQTRPGWSNLRAYREQKVFGIYHNFSMHFFGFVCIEALAKDFYPAAFQDLHPEADFKAFHDQYMPIPLRGVWMLPTENQN
ncbi:MAG: ABC transporter substrate-binding protein [Chthoniobacteraceae bacterium]